ncbi:MAG: ECF transporter S component [Firmicutes bacterium]|nr:ECF transporter S component [Bacillota bacterium]
MLNLNTTNNTSNTRKLTQTALFVALGVLLPTVFHTIPRAGGIFLPMHIPILLCAVVCGFPYGTICAVLMPLLSNAFTGMPDAAMLPSMMFELLVYGAVTPLLMRVVKVKNFYAKIYIVLIGAMLCGRAAGGVANALIFRAGNYSFEIWLSAAFLISWPGILIQLAVIPSILVALKKARLFNAGIGY